MDAYESWLELQASKKFTASESNQIAIVTSEVLWTALRKYREFKKTCTMSIEPIEIDRTWVCSECGTWHIDDSKPHYCMTCGATVTNV